ncbi:fumarylacetoacetate hydrolase family protein [Pelagibacterales bacterium SAG-MED39]|nr:fumarylacetoacetate hydrolase family protein [Pelagibacterales bacterium SAG-MED39]
MKLLRVGDVGKEIPAVLDGENIIRSLSKHIKDFNPENLNFETLDKIKKTDLKSLPIIKSKSRIGSCITKPTNFFAIGLNYKAHADETNSDAPKEPIVFNKSPNCIVGPYDNVIIPKSSKALDHEVEIAVVIGGKVQNVEEEEAQKFILGYCICNDISEREWQKNRGGQWVKGKSGDTFGPLGPYLVTKDEIKDLYNLNLSLDLNGKRRQTGNTSLMIFNFDFLISHISQFLTLMPGDIITTGTPAGVGMGMNPPDYLKDGDQMILKVEDLGEQKLNVIKEK